jgi:hypothetical protein
LAVVEEKPRRPVQTLTAEAVAVEHTSPTQLVAREHRVRATMEEQEHQRATSVLVEVEEAPEPLAEMLFYLYPAEVEETVLALTHRGVQQHQQVKTSAGPIGMAEVVAVDFLTNEHLQQPRAVQVDKAVAVEALNGKKT